MPMGLIKRISSFFLLAVSAIQIYGVGERLWHALWMSYKFSSDGYTTMSHEMFWFTVIVSIASLFFSIYLNVSSSDKATKLASKISGVSLSTGLLVVLVLVISPMGQLR